MAKADVTVNDFGAFLDMRRCRNLGSYNLLSIQLSDGLFFQFFPEHRVPHFLISTLNSFQGVLKVSGCSGLDLILAEADGKCQFSVGRTPSGS